MPSNPKPAWDTHLCRPKLEQPKHICSYRWAKDFVFARSLTDLSCKPKEETAQSEFPRVRLSTDHIVLLTDHQPICVFISLTPKGSIHYSSRVVAAVNLQEFPSHRDFDNKLYQL